MLITLHRAEIVDNEARLRQFVLALDLMQRKFSVPIIASMHPCTKSKMEEFGITVDNAGIRFLEQFGFVDFIALEQQAMCAI